MTDMLKYEALIPDQDELIEKIMQCYERGREGGMENKIKMEVLGPGCKNCDDLYDNVRKAVEQAGLTGKPRWKK